MTVIGNAATVLIVVAAMVVLGALVDLVQRALVGKRQAARAALEHDYELRLIDAEALAKGLRAIDEAA